MIPKGNEFYFRIKGLMVPKRRVENNFCDSINRYVDIAQTLSEKLENNFTNKRMDYFLMNMETTLSLLRSIYARWLEAEAEVILNAAKNNRIDVCKKFLQPFITGLLTLSIDIQKAQSSAKQEADNEIENHADMASNLSSVGKLIDFGEYESVRNLLSDMEEYGGAGIYGKLIDLVMSKKYNEAGELANLLKDNHMSFIKDSGDGAATATKKVLAVDDRPEILNTVNNALNGHYKVFGVTTGKAAINFIQAQKPGLFILDIEMPELNGFQLAEIIRATAGCENIPIIFLTSSSTRDHVMKAIEVGGNDFIVKPASHDALLAKARKYFP